MRFQIKHGHCKRGKITRTYVCWQNMIARCEYPNDPDYRYYGARGINVCRRWKSFANFLKDMGEKPPRITIERKDVNGNYNPSNCRWATRTEQNQNQRKTIKYTRNGKTMCEAQWEREMGFPRFTMSNRRRLGWTGEKLFAPIAKHKNKKA